MRRLAARTGILEQVGRVFAVVGPVVVVVAFTHHDGWLPTPALLLSAVWCVSINFGFAGSRTTLACLGPGIIILQGTALGLVATAALGNWIPGLQLGLDVQLLLAASIFGAVFTWETFVARRLIPLQRLLLIGPREACASVISELDESGRFSVVGVVDEQRVEVGTDPYVVGSLRDLRRVIRVVQPDLVALVPGCDRPAAFRELLRSTDSSFRVLELAQFFEYAFGRVPVRDLTTAWFMSVLHMYQRPYSKLVKRVADLVGALLLLVLTAPLFVVVALIVSFTGRPILLRQTRVGEHGCTFTMYKFRTMHTGAERPGEAVWAAANDPRVTIPGRILRRYRLDELPQIWNVARGQMSIVGPRPERPEFTEELVESVPFWTCRYLVKPGITGWAQVKRGYTADSEGTIDKLGYDLWYIRHRSLTVDVAILARTVVTALHGDRAAARDRANLDLAPTLVGLEPQLEADSA